MSSRDRKAPQHEDKEKIDTMKALIEVYKSAFGDDWKNVYISTVRVNIG
jgi:hypothetical protein